jgi:hypothetical protein
MSNKPPKDVAQQVKEAVYKKADDFEYLTRSRTCNGQFLDSLVLDPMVGDKLVSYMSRAEIRTYIKDAILNRYSKDKTLVAKPKNVSDIIYTRFSVEAEKIEKNARLKISLYKGIESNCYVVVAEGTYLKWETALRKAILYIPDKPFCEKNNVQIYILLNVFAQHKKIAASDKDFLLKALQPFNAAINIYGEK